MFVKVVKKFNQIMLWLLGVLLVLAMVLTVAFKLYTSNYYKADVDSIASIEAEVGENVQVYSDDDLLVFIPSRTEVKAIIAFYPGGKVEYKAYSGLMYELANRGFLCLLPRMPENLAFLETNSVDIIKEQYPAQVKFSEGLDWYLAGHSLGGVAAAEYLGKQSDGVYKGIIMCASYPSTDFSTRDLRLLSIYGSEDGVLKMRNYENSKRFWPEDSTEYVIEGGIHSYFGNYGIQSGDGEPSITNVEQIKIAADVISDFISG